MIKLLARAFLLGLLCLGIQAKSQSLSELEWMLGTWATDASEGESQSFEIWNRMSEQQFQGVAYTVSKKDTSVTESLEIAFKMEQAYYIADVPQNPTPVYFRIVEMTDTSLIVENPRHDFPKRIKYHRNGGLLNITISSGKRQKEFQLKKVNND